MAVDVAADDPLREPVGGNMRRAGVVRPDARRAGFKRFPERGDALLQLAHHHVAAVEAEIAETLGRAVRGQARCARVRIVDGTIGPGAFS